MTEYYKVTVLNRSDFAIIEKSEGYQTYVFDADGVCNEDYWREELSQVMSDLVELNILTSLADLEKIRVVCDEKLRESIS